MVEDRFYDPEVKDIEEQTEEAYEKYLEDMELEDGKPMSQDEFIDWYWRY